MKKRFWALFLAVMMIVSVLPTTAFAADATITITVRDENSNPISGASVEIRRYSGDRVTGTTDANGQVALQFDKSDNGYYTVTVKASGYRDYEWYNWGSQIPGTLSVELRKSSGGNNGGNGGTGNSIGTLTGNTSYIKFVLTNATWKSNSSDTIEFATQERSGLPVGSSNSTKTITGYVLECKSDLETTFGNLVAGDITDLINPMPGYALIDDGWALTSGGLVGQELSGSAQANAAALLKEIDDARSGIHDFDTTSHVEGAFQAATVFQLTLTPIEYTVTYDEISDGRTYFYPGAGTPNSFSVSDEEPEGEDGYTFNGWTLKGVGEVGAGNVFKVEDYWNNDEVVGTVTDGTGVLELTSKWKQHTHTPGQAVRENEVPATCYAEGSYDEVVYCAVEACKHEISRTPKTIEKIAHTPADPVRENEVPATCYAEGSYDEVVYCAVEACKYEISRTHKTIEKIAHTPADPVRENEVPATCDEAGSYDEVVYCAVEACKAELNRTPKTIDKLIHTWGPWTEDAENGNHKRVCNYNVHTEIADHVWGDWAKCEGDPLTEERICGDCGAKEYRDVDEKGKLEGDKETGDGIGDKYQVFVWYKAGANGSLEGEIYKAYTLGKEGDAELLKEVTLTYPTTVPYSGYAFDKWILPAQVTINGTTMSNFQVGTTYTFTATFGADNKGNLDGDKETGDGTPDKYQVFVWYKAGDNGSLEGKTYYAYDLRINGTTELRSTVSLNYPTPVARHGFDFDGWLEPADVVISEDTMRQFTVGETYVFTAMFSRDRGDRPVAEPTVKVKGLNSDDHVACVVGRGEGMFDPMGKVTRAEVATIYFRLMTEEFRTEFWTDVNSFSDVVGTDWYNVAISTLENAGVIQDTVTGGEFRPNDPITRAELAVMAAQFATVTGKIPETSFKDVDKDYWAYDEIKLIECAGWIEGYRGYFRPDDNLTRAECVTIVNRMLKRGAEEDNMLEDMVIFLDNLDQDMWYYEAIQEAANSHDYTRTKVKLEGENFNGEIWTVLLDAPDWAALEQAWSQAHVE